MKFRISCRIDYALQPPTTLLFNVRASHSQGQTVLSEEWTFTPGCWSEEIISTPEQNRFDRVIVEQETAVTLRYQAEVEVEPRFINTEALGRVPAAQLAPSQLPYLLPSRYCQSDRMSRFARQKFGNIRDVSDQVLKITEWIHENVEYVPGTTTETTSACDTLTECVGVCRDFAHLGIALCRALTIPARYFTGYAAQLQPPDFHACFEAYIGGCWVLFDATHLASPHGLVRIGSGRDAADVSVCTLFGGGRTTGQEVTCEVEGEVFIPMTSEQLQETAISLDSVPG